MSCRHSRFCGPCLPMRGQAGSIFYEHVQRIAAPHGTGRSEAICTAQARQVTAFIKNTGAAHLTAVLENSPNGADFVTDPQRLELDAGQTGYLTPYVFSKYMRVCVTAAGAGCANLYFQMQEG